MKAKISPTSPKYKVEELNRLYQRDDLKKIDRPIKRVRGDLILVIVIAIIFGFLAGLLGKITLDYFLANYPEYTLKVLNTNQNESNIFAWPETKNEVNLTEVTQNVNASQVNIYYKKEFKENSLDGVYLSQDLLGYGAVISSDGLIVTTKAVINDYEKEYGVVTDENKVYTVQGIMPDPATDFIFLKIEAKDLKVAEFSDSEQVSVGDYAAVFKSTHNLKDITLRSTQIEKIIDYPIEKTEDLIQSSEKLNKLTTVNDNFDESFEGSFLVDKKGKVLGLGRFKNQIKKNGFIPSKYIENKVNEILKENAVIRPYLGLHYLNLSYALNLSSSLSQDLKTGLLVYGSIDTPAVLKGSPAAKAGLLERDIILKINDSEITPDFDFSEDIQGREIGETLTLVLKRDGSEKKVEVKLTKQPEL